MNFCDRAKALDNTADGVVVFGGTNDFGLGDAPLGSFADRGPTTFYGACHALYSTLRKRFNGKPIVILTPLHRIGEGTNAHGRALKEYVDAIRTVAE